jgi:Flagellar hook-length control protein FliK
MDIAPIQPVSLDALKSLGLADGLREGRVLQARVEAMLSNTLARMRIDGQAVDLATTRPLPVGALLTLKVERREGKLALVAQGPAKTAAGASTPALGGNSIPAKLADPLRMALEKIRAMTVESMLAESDAADTSRVPAASRDPQAAEDGAPARQPPAVAAERPDAKAPGSAMRSDVLNEAAPEARQHVAARYEALSTMAVHAGPEGQGGAQRASAFTIEIPVPFPGQNAPLQLQVTREDEREAEEGGEPRPPSWTVRFAAEAGPLGMVHAAISLVNGHIGVQLWAERGGTAARFKAGAGELSDAMQASGLTFDGVIIAEGSPARGS